MNQLDLAQVQTTQKPQRGSSTGVRMVVYGLQLAVFVMYYNLTQLLEVNRITDTLKYLNKNGKKSRGS